MTAIIRVGNAMTRHDPAVAILGPDGQIFAEAVERWAQCKRAYGAVGISGLANGGVGAIGRFADEHSLRDLAGSLLTLATWDHHRLRAILGDGHEIWQFLDRADLWGIGEETVDSSQYALSRFTTFLRNKVFRASEISAPRSLEHHLCHAALAMFTSPFDEAGVMIVDGGGESGGCAFYRFKDNEFELIESAGGRRLGTPEMMNQGYGGEEMSLGFLYSWVTELCGFDPYRGEEWKVMGLAAYGTRNPKVVDYFQSRIKIDGLKVYGSFDPENDEGVLDELVGGFRDPLDPDWIKAADLACSFQEAYENVVCELASEFHARCGSDNLAFGGGCALNSSANGKMLQRTPFKQLHVPSAPADDGNALGAVLLDWHRAGGARFKGPMSPYLGSSIPDDDVSHVSRFQAVPPKVCKDEPELCAIVAGELASGKIIGWVQGRAEFGPRALGNRSILADPRATDMREKINDRIKFREPYRPIAPSILHEHGDEYFHDYSFSPYMERTAVFREDKHGSVPAVVHTDGTGRLQSVTRELNPRFHALLTEFFRVSGVPILVNTSLNVMGKPIVHSASDALATFYSSGMDILVINQTIFYKK